MGLHEVNIPKSWSKVGATDWVKLKPDPGLKGKRKQDSRFVEQGRER